MEKKRVAALAEAATAAKACTKPMDPKAVIEIEDDLEPETLVSPHDILSLLRGLGIRKDYKASKKGEVFDDL